MTNFEKLRETFPKTFFIFRKNGNDETTAIACSDDWLQGDYEQMYKCDRLKLDGMLEDAYEHGYQQARYDYEVQPCDRCVSIEAVMQTLYDYGCESEIQDAIAELPPVTPKPKTGHWMEIGDEPYDTWECDNCGFVIDGSGCVDPEEYRDVYKYCPNCGAKMEGVSE